MGNGCGLRARGLMLIPGELHNWLLLIDLNAKNGTAEGDRSVGGEFHFGMGLRVPQAFPQAGGVRKSPLQPKAGWNRAPECCRAPAEGWFAGRSLGPRSKARALGMTSQSWMGRSGENPHFSQNRGEMGHPLGTNRTDQSESRSLPEVSRMKHIPIRKLRLITRTGNLSP